MIGSRGNEDVMSFHRNKPPTVVSPSVICDVHMSLGGNFFSLSISNSIGSMLLASLISKILQSVPRKGFTRK